MRFRNLVLSLLLLPTLAAPAAQTPAAPRVPSQKEMANRIRDQFLHAWNGYHQYAWGHDELRPLSNQPFDWYGTSLLMTPVDALDTLILMGLHQQADEDRQLIDTQLSFDKDIYVKNFEITIRMLGGLLSSYELTGDPRLLALADDLGTRLLLAFDSPTGMPYVWVNLKTGAVRGEDTNPAEVGTLLLEFGTLSKLTHKPIYYDKAKRAVVEIWNRRSPLNLIGSEINIRTGAWTGPDPGATDANIEGGSDSYYEYLLKAWLLFHDEDCHRMWLASVAALNQYVAQTVTYPDRSTGFWYGEANMNTGARTGTEYGALAAFFAGSLALSGDLDRARRLQDSNYRMWNLTGIEPEELDYSTMKILYPGYELRPEIIESAYYLEYFTHDPLYRQMGMTFFNNIVKDCRTPTAFAALSDVRTMKQRDDMESFFFAETLKYLYLLLADTNRIDLSRTVFNTEAHPLNIDMQPIAK
ncbi:MAG TPA: glycoside hydrolase family 47 protein [Acidobacteriaceae bacterium]|jgi:mannosidase alpha-like ER degradation enhancer 2|nr:glycoside hydrolase family 47 protein [Acidobacteriaceae bacterium]